ncbi:MAG TPA: ABC transporter ATP-binding protein [Phycisphaerae bacterium]|nr:ABC transporter ATP-binding protein [Phycisphaerae bacterium]HUT56760.1 ABC transporter ATP-binding protein [Phycisphaerae bacterium]
MSRNNDSVVHCDRLTKIYDEIVALEDLSLDIPAGHIFGYIGHNGAGKTTTIRILAGLLEATRGSATICGVDVGSGRDRIKSMVGYMPDSFGVYDQMRVWEYLDFFGAAFKIPRARRRDRIDHVLDITEAEYMRDRFVDTLSHGMKQRVGIARTLMHDPQVLLLDEPANGLDPNARVQMRKLLRRLADGGKTLIVSSHILPELAAVCDSVGIIHEGHLRAWGPLHKVLSEIQRDRLMELKVIDPAQMPQAHKTVTQDDRVSQTDESDKAEGVLRFRFKGDDSALSRLLQSAVSAGIGVVTLREIPLSLEDAYMAISGISSEVPDSGPQPAEDSSAS